jgi:hypothetical protein
MTFRDIWCVGSRWYLISRHEQWCDGIATWRGGRTQTTHQHFTQGWGYTCVGINDQSNAFRWTFVQIPNFSGDTSERFGWQVLAQSVAAAPRVRTVSAGRHSTTRDLGKSCSKKARMCLSSAIRNQVVMANKRSVCALTSVAQKITLVLTLLLTDKTAKSRSELFFYDIEPGQ